MCEAVVYLDDREIARDVVLLESFPEGIRLSTLFEPPRVVPAVIREIDLLKHQVRLQSVPAAEGAP
jgi:predicted RNA-binding protein